MTNLENRNNSKKKKTINPNYFFFITIFSFGGALVDWGSAASESLLLGSPLAGIGRVVSIISILECTFFSLCES